jgi:hypothetical protein
MMDRRQQKAMFAHAREREKHGGRLGIPSVFRKLTLQGVPNRARDPWVWPNYKSRAMKLPSQMEALQPVKAEMGGGLFDFRADKPNTTIFRGPFKEAK